MRQELIFTIIALLLVYTSQALNPIKTSNKTKKTCGCGFSTIVRGGHIICRRIPQFCPEKFIKNSCPKGSFRDCSYQKLGKKICKCIKDDKHEIRPKSLNN